MRLAPQPPSWNLDGIDTAGKLILLCQKINNRNTVGVEGEENVRQGPARRAVPLRWLNTVLAVCELCHLPNHDK